MVPVGRFELLTRACEATSPSQAGVNPYDVELSRRVQSCLLTTRCQTPWHVTRKGCPRIPEVRITLNSHFGWSELVFRTRCPMVGRSRNFALFLKDASI